MFIINGKVKHLSKYDKNDKKWRECRTVYENGRCASIVEYRPIIKETEDGINYVIVAYNTTLEVISENYDVVSGRELSMDKIYEHFNNENDNYYIQLFLMDADAPIVEDACKLAEYIDTLSLNPKTKSINLIGISECGAMSFYVPRFFKAEDSYKKTNIYTVGTPFNGTITYSPKIIYELIKDRIISRFRDNSFSKILQKRMIALYKDMLASSHRYHDVAVLGVIPSDKLEFYDASFVMGIFSKENVLAIRKLQSYKNFILQINSKVVMEAVKKHNKPSLKYCLMDSVLFGGNNSDGVVPINSQESVKEYLGDIVTSEVLYSTHNVLENDSALIGILDAVNDTIKKQASTDGVQKKIGPIK